MKWQPHDPSWLVDLARRQCPEQPWLPEALALCTQTVRERAYWYFVDPDSEEWRFAGNIHLEGKSAGPLVLDVLEGPRVGGVEFLKRI